MTQRKEGVLKKEKENDYLIREREEEEEEPRNKKECFTMENHFNVISDTWCELSNGFKAHIT